MRGLCRLLIFLGLVMANGASGGRSHQPVVASDVSRGTADDRTFDAALCVSRKRHHYDGERQ
jgi:hypothetical protein